MKKKTLDASILKELKVGMIVEYIDTEYISHYGFITGFETCKWMDSCEKRYGSGCCPGLIKLSNTSYPQCLTLFPSTNITKITSNDFLSEKDFEL